MLLIPYTYSDSYNVVNSQTFIAKNRSAYNLSTMTMGARIASLLEQQDMSQSELARRVGIAQPTISALIHGNNAGSKHLHKIAAVLGTTPGYLSGDTDDPSEDAVSLPSPELFAEQFNLALIPELELGYSMGGGSIFDDFRHTGIVPFQRDWLRGMMRGNFEDLFVARGEGDSMQPTLLDGDIVLIDTAQKDIRQQDRIWALAYGDLGMIKRVRRLSGGTYSIMSDNPAVAPFTAVDDEMYVIGRVVWIGRKI